MILRINNTVSECTGRGPTPTHQYLWQRSCCPPTFWSDTCKYRTKGNYIFSYNFSFYCPNQCTKTGQNRPKWRQTRTKTYGVDKTLVSGCAMRLCCRLSAIIAHHIIITSQFFIPKISFNHGVLYLSSAPSAQDDLITMVPTVERRVGIQVCSSRVIQWMSMPVQKSR